MTQIQTFRSRILSLGLALSALLSSCGGGGGGGDAPLLVSIQVTPPSASVALGATRPMVAIGKYSDVTTRDISKQVFWTSSDASVASVSNAPGSRGLALGLAQGTATISAKLAGVTGHASVAVTDAALVALELTPTNPSIAQGTAQAFVATGRYSDHSIKDLSAQVAWSTSDAAVADVSNDPLDAGRAFGAGIGSATISAELDGVAGATTCTVTDAVLVALEVTPTAPELARGTGLQLVATGRFSDLSTQDLSGQAAWSSSDELVAQVSGAGFALAIEQGAASLSASFAGVVGSTSLTVTDAALVAVDVAPTEPAIALGTTTRLIATGTFSDLSTQDLSVLAAWSSSDVAVATVGSGAPDHGLARGAGVGGASIAAESLGVSGATTLTVTPATLVALAITPGSATLPLGLSQPLVATGTFSDGSTQDLTAQATWQALQPAVAAVSNAAGSQGLATTVAAGTTSILATFAGVQGAATLTVTNAALLAIEVAPPAPVVALGHALALHATGSYSDGSTLDLTQHATWTSSDAAVAVVSNAAGSRGLATSVAVGATTISAHFQGKSGGAALTVSDATLVAIDVTPALSTLALGLSLQLVATGVYTDGSTQDLTAAVGWSALDGGVVAVSNAAGSQGLATGVGLGSTTVTAALAGVAGQASLTVSGAVLVAIEVSPQAPVIALGTQQQLAAIGVFSDASAQDLTTQVTWASSSPAVAAVSNAAGSEGLAVAQATGSTTITASFAGQVGSATLTVSSAALVALEVAPFLPNLPSGLELQFGAIGTFTDGSTQDLTAQVAWSSSDALVATISNAQGSAGLARGVAAGSTTITAALEGLSDATELAVTDAVLVELAVSPATVQLPRGLTRQLAAIGTFSDGSTQDMTEQAAWSSSAPAVAAVSNAAGSRGLASGLAVGAATISASHSGVAGSADFAVTDAVLVAIEIAPAPAFLPSGYKRALAATGTWSDGSTLPLTEQATWTSTVTSVATVSNADGARGLVTAVAVGTTTISASFAGVAGTAQLTVSNEKLVSLSIAPSPVDLALGEQAQLIATGTFSGGTVLDVTAQVQWSSSAKPVASVNNGADKGLVTAKRSGSATIRAKKGNKSAHVVVTVP